MSDGAPTIHTAQENTRHNEFEITRLNSKVAQLKRELAFEKLNSLSLREKMKRIRKSRWYRFGRKLRLCP